jgi:YVTN family beta-propeller protein
MRFVLMFAMCLPMLAQPLKPAATIPLEGVRGRIDHMAVDLDGKRLFVAALGNNTIEVIDLSAGKVTRSIPGIPEPQGLAYMPAAHKLFAASRGDGKLRIYDESWNVSVQDLGSDADNVRFDAGANRIYVGYGEGALAAIDSGTGRKISDVPLGSHPESFQLETKSPRMFVNLPPDHVSVVDRNANRVVATWPIPGSANYPMALDETNGRLFIGCRKPPKLLVLDTGSGRQIASLPIVGDTDDLFYDSAAHRLYVIGGAGSIDVIAQGGPDRYEHVASVATASGARTGLFVAGLKRLYVAVPHRGTQRASIRVFSTE